MSLIVTNNAQFILAEGENLLDALERTGHEVEYQCREGYCGSCRVKVRSGKENVGYDDFPLAFLAPDEILPCHCKITGQIEIDCTQEKVPVDVQPELFPESDVSMATNAVCAKDGQNDPLKVAAIKKPIRNSLQMSYSLRRVG